MSAHKKQWLLKPGAPQELIQAMPELEPLIVNLLYQRGITAPEQIQAFFTNNYRAGMHDPFLLHGMQAAARRIVQAINNQEAIAVYGDFDTDGVTAVTLLTQTITAMGGNIRPYIPHRMREGYGLNSEAIDQLNTEGIRLLITVDCGISNSVEVEHANSVGIDVIVTDHHTPPDLLPNALAIVNPKLVDCPYPYKQLVGVGIAYKLVQALVRLGMRMPLRGRELLDVVALGTVTDMGPLTGENRVLVKAGLEAINETQRPGLRALIDVAGLRQGKISASDIGFMLGPRLNAAGRLDDALLSYELLLADNLNDARVLAGRLNEANIRRQKMTQQALQASLQLARETGKYANKIIVLDSPDFPAGIVGLVAGKVVEEFARPALLIERGESLSRGSARSIPNFSIIEALKQCEDLLVRYGGHTAAAGFTISNDNIPELERRLLDYAESRLPEQAESVLEIDTEIDLAELSLDFLQHIKALEPFGQANQQPIFQSSSAYVAGAWVRGADGQHLKLRLEDSQSGKSYEAIAFKLGKLAGYFARHPWIDIAYTLDEHEWNGKTNLQLVIKDLRRSKPPL